MNNSKLTMLCLTLFIGILSASTTSESGGSLLCNIKILIYGILPTAALILFLLTPFAFGLAVIAIIIGYIFHRKQNSEGKIDIRNFNSLHTALKIGLIILIGAILCPVVGAACILLAIVLPIIISMLVGSSGVSATC